MAYKKWKPSKQAKAEYAAKMSAIESFCKENGIHQSAKGDSFYFNINGQNYRVSNHSVEASNAAAFDEFTGEQVRQLYHEGGRDSNTIYIHAGKQRIMDIYNDLQAGYKLDGRGNRMPDVPAKAAKASPLNRKQLLSNAKIIAEKQQSKPAPQKSQSLGQDR